MEEEMGRGDRNGTVRGLLKVETMNLGRCSEKRREGPVQDFL